MPTESARQALGILRDGSQFQWYVIPLLVIVFFLYATEVERRNWSGVSAGLAFWGMDWFNEIWNGLVFHLTQYAPVWGAPGKTAYLILVGLNIEISLMFALLGLAFVKTLPADRKRKVLGLPNRLFFSICGSALCVFVEVLLNAVGALTWEWPWWNARAPWLIFLAGYLHFFLVASWTYDMKTVRSKAITVGAIFGVDVAALLLFGCWLRWV